MGKRGEPPRDQCPGATPGPSPPPAVSRSIVAFVWPYPAAKPVGKLCTQWCGGFRKTRLLRAPLTQRPEARASSIEALVLSPCSRHSPAPARARRDSRVEASLPAYLTPPAAGSSRKKRPGPRAPLLGLGSPPLPLLSLHHRDPGWGMEAGVSAHRAAIVTLRKAGTLPSVYHRRWRGRRQLCLQT